MKNQLKTILYLFTVVFAVLLLVAGCKKEESPFSGHDNHVVSFAVTLADGTKYVAAIAGNDIVLTVPAGVKLSGAKAECVLCENASIVPDPATVTDWDQDQIFRVQAYNNSYVKYTYSVKYSSVVENGTVTLTTQAEVDAFGEKNITTVDGNLIIGNAVEPLVAYDTIKNVDALSSIAEVALNIIVNETYRGVNLDGLRNVKKAGGLYIGTQSRKAALKPVFEVSFPLLETAGTIVMVSDSIAAISMPVLKTITNNLHIGSKKIKELNLQSLAVCSGNLTITGLSQGETSITEAVTNQVLRSVLFPALEKVEGALSIEQFWKVTSLEMPELSGVGKALNIVTIRNLKTLSLPKLVSVKNGMTVQSNDEMTAFSAPVLKEAGSLLIASLNVYSINLKKIELPVLEKSNGDFTILYAAMENLAFPGLKSIAGTCKMDNLLFLETLSMPLLEECGSMNLNNIKNIREFDMGKVQKVQDLSVGGCTSLASFKAPGVVTGNVSLSNSSKTVFTLPDLAGLDTIRGTLSISAGNFTELVLPAVKTIGTFVLSSGSYLTSVIIPATDSIGRFSLANLSKLTRFSAPALEKCNSFNLSGSVLLTGENIDLPVLASVKEGFSLLGGSYSSQASQSKITDLNAFASLKSAGKVEVKYCGSLTDFTGLKNVIGNVSGWTTVDNKYNPTLQDMKAGKYKME